MCPQLNSWRRTIRAQKNDWYTQPTINITFTHVCNGHIMIRGFGGCNVLLWLAFLDGDYALVSMFYTNRLYSYVNISNCN